MTYKRCIYNVSTFSNDMMPIYFKYKSELIKYVKAIDDIEDICSVGYNLYRRNGKLIGSGSFNVEYTLGF